MKKIINILTLLSLSFVIYSCSDDLTLQKYYIDKQDSKDFISLDVPASVIQLKADVPDEAREAYESLKKMNILAFAKNENNQATLIEEQAKVKSILKNNRYKELMTFKDKGRNVVVKYEGDTDKIDEVIVFASDKDQGFALVRVLGDNMNPAKIAKLANSISDIDSEGFKQLGDLFKNKK